MQVYNRHLFTPNIFLKLIFQNGNTFNGLTILGHLSRDNSFSQSIYLLNITKTSRIISIIITI